MLLVVLLSFLDSNYFLIADLAHLNSTGEGPDRYNKVTCFGHGDTSDGTWSKDEPMNEHNFANG